MASGDLSYDVVDVFAETPYAGNQLAVVHGAAHLSDGQLLAIAREFNYSETTFPTPRSSESYAVRIFTPGGELPFAGHPTLGTAWVLRQHGRLTGPEVVQHCGAGEVGVSFSGDRVELTAAPRDLAGPLPDATVVEVLEDLGLSAEDRDGDAWVAGAGLNFLHIPVVDAAIERARPSARALSTYSAVPELTDPLEGINLVAINGGEVHARVFVPLLSVPEDPATGSAAAGLGMMLAASGRLPDGGSYAIAQGLEMGRPSRLVGTVEAVDGRPTSCRVAGRVHPVARGNLRVPPP